jgi:ADP-heptose:LPS heptosyltransferase
MLPTTPQRILLVRLSANGDIVQSFETLKQTRQRFPNAFIGWVVSSEGASLLEQVSPYVDAIHILPKHAWSKNWIKAFFPLLPMDTHVAEVLRNIKAQRYEVAIDVQGLNKSAVLPWILGIPYRIGFENAREQARFFYTHTPARWVGFCHPTQHATLEFASLLQAWTAPPTETKPLAKRPSLAELPLDLPFTRLKTYKAEGKRLYGFAPFTMWASKQWPRSHWQALIEQLLHYDPEGIGVCLGGPADVSTWQAWTKALAPDLQSRLIHLEGKTQWPQLWTVLGHIDVLIGSDSVTLHMMDWLLKESLHPKGQALALMGPTHPLRTGALSTHAFNLHHDLPCSPCHQKQCPLGTHACMTALTPTQVFETLAFSLPAPSFLKH